MAWRSCSVLFRAGEGLFRCSTKSGSRWPHSFQQRCGFRKASRKPESKKMEEDLGSSRTEPVEAELHHRTSPSDAPRAGQLVKPLVFTVGFTGCSFGLAAIWQYESVKFRVQNFFDQIHADWLEKMRPQKRGDFRKEVNQWWNSLSEGQKTVTGIIAANVLVFCCWRVPSLQPTMLKYFISTPASKTLCSPMLLSTFSHYSFFHMAANMYVLWSFSSSAVSMLGKEQFMALYLSAGVVSTFVSYVSKVATGRLGMSVGASGAIMTILATVCTKMPEAKLAIIFLPMFTFTAANALKAIVALDATGLLLGWRFFDHAAHLGGSMFGIWYALYGHDLIWKNREPFVKIWHQFRTRGNGGRGGGGGGPGSGGSV